MMFGLSKRYETVEEVQSEIEFYEIELGYTNDRDEELEILEVLEQLELMLEELQK